MKTIQLLKILTLLLLCICHSLSYAQQDKNNESVFDYTSFFDKDFNFTQLGLNAFMEFQNDPYLSDKNFKIYLQKKHYYGILNKSRMVELSSPPEILFNPQIIANHQFLGINKSNKNPVILEPNIINDFNTTEKLDGSNNLSFESFLLNTKNININYQKTFIKQETLPKPDLSINPHVLEINNTQLYFDEKENFTIYGLNTFINYKNNESYKNKTFYQYLNHTKNNLMTGFDGINPPDIEKMYTKNITSYLDAKNWNIVGKMTLGKNTSYENLDRSKNIYNSNTQQYKFNHKSKDWKYELFYNLLHSERFKINNNNKTNIKKMSINNDKCIYPLDENALYRICESKRIKFPNTTKSIKSITEIFCKSIQNTLSTLSQSICKKSDDTNVDFKQLKINVNKNISQVTVITYRQEMKIDNAYYPIVNADVTIANYEDYYIIYKPNLHLSELQVEKSAIKNSLTNYHEISDEDLSRLINIGFNMELDWACTLIDNDDKSNKNRDKNISLLKLYNGTNQIKMVYPVINKICHIKGNKYTDIRAKLTLDAVNGMVLKDIIVIDEYKNISIKLKESSKNPYVMAVSNFKEFKSLENIEHSYAKELADNLFDLFGYISKDFSSNFNKEDLKFYFYDQDNKCKCDVTVGCASDNKICLHHSADIQPIKDLSLVIHEYLHLIIPRFLTTNCSNLKDCRSNIISYNSLFHDLADILMMQYLDIQSFGIDIKAQLEESSDLDEDFEHEFEVRKITGSENLYDHIPLESLANTHTGYYLGTYIGRMFQIAKDTHQKNSDQLEGIIKHWIRMLRALKTYEYSSLLCNDCDLDYFTYLQNIMNAYWLQLVNTPDQYLIRDLFFEWSKAGFHLTNPECIDMVINNNDKCDFSLTKKDVLKKNFGLAHSKLVSKEDNNLTFQVISGITYFINHDSKLELFKEEEIICNDMLIVEFYNCEDLVYCKLNDNNFVGSIEKPIRNFNNVNDKNICLSTNDIHADDTITFGNSQFAYKDLVERNSQINGSNALRYYIRTYKINEMNKANVLIRGTAYDKLNFAQPIFKPTLQQEEIIYD